ncbi:MAG: tetratricopeptide repeat protein, partial [Campylobacterota bacterium]|nr:tetratricopeptide repeat protein [Campylobacterota bacterium]
FFAYDIDNYKKKHPQKKVVIFLDTYEALWQNVRNESNRLSQDVWIRDGLVSELQNVLFVICGREKIIWAEDDSAWESDLNQHILGGLSENDAKSFLDSCNIEDIVIQDEIIKSSEGLPFYLDLSVDTYYKIKDSGKTPSVQDFSEVGKDDIFERFMRYLSLQEKETLKVLAHARFYTKDIFSLLVDTFKTAYPVTAMAELNTFSFISQEDDIFFIHDLMRKSLISSQSTDLKEDVNTTLFNLYDEKLQDLDIKNISEESIEALHEAFYHKECLGDINVLDDWYDKLYHIFKQAAKYKILLELSIKLNKLHETSLGEEHPSTAAGYHNLAVLYEAMGNHLEALSLYKQALAINEKVLGEEHPDTATIYNNLAVLYMDMGKLEEALPLCKKALAINEKVLGKEHPDTAMSYNNYANLYLSMGNSAEALPLYKKALEINKKELGEQHPKTAISYNNLAELYKSMRNYEEALPLYKKALAINEKALGEEHPHTAVSYNSLAGLYESMGNYEEALPLYK